VTFKATLFQDNTDISFIEKSRFLKVEDKWLYIDGQFIDEGKK
jgi:SEC-C motif-containing protein